LLLFLRLNGRRLTADQVSATRMMFAVAAGEIGIEDLAAWIRTNSEAA
jgi:prophage maintenance system killer protein